MHTLLCLNYPEMKNLPDASIFKQIVPDLDVLCVTNKALAEEIISEKGEIEFFITNYPQLHLFTFCKSKHPNCHTIFISPLSFHQYSKSMGLSPEDSIEQFISSTHHQYSVDLLRITLQKIRNKNLFGLEQYINVNSPTQTFPIYNSDRKNLCQKVQSFAENSLLSLYKSKLQYAIAEELIMNATKNAPTYFLETENNETEEYRNKLEKAQLSVTCDRNIFAISITDFFGLLSKENLFHYIKKILKKESEDLLDKKQIGAGLGFFKILHSCHAIICNVAPQKQTEVISILQLDHPLLPLEKQARTIQFFKE